MTVNVFNTRRGWYSIDVATAGDLLPKPNTETGTTMQVCIESKILFELFLVELDEHENFTLYLISGSKLAFAPMRIRIAGITAWRDRWIRIANMLWIQLLLLTFSISELILYWLQETIYDYCPFYEFNILVVSLKAKNINLTFCVEI